jgi:cobalt-zinc-cadmium efflux system outer membrane protein
MRTIVPWWRGLSSYAFSLVVAGLRTRGLRLPQFPPVLSFMLHYILKTIPIVLAVAASVARGETLQSLTAEALRNNPELRVLEQSVASAKGGVVTARTFQNPELSLAPGMRRTRTEGGAQKEFHGELLLSQLFKFPGKRALEIALAQRNVQANELALEAFRFQIAAKVRRAFYEMLGAQRSITVRQEQVESAKVFAESARKRAESGYAGDFETIKSQADLISANKALAGAQGRAAAARVILNTLVARPPSAMLQITGTLIGIAPRGGSAAFVALAMARNPALRAQEIAAEKAGLSLRATRFGRRPDFAIGPSIEYLKDEQTYGISATIALPLWDRKKGEIQTATAEQQKALAELEKLRVEVRGEVTKSAEMMRIATSQLALYSPAFLEKLKNFVQQAEQGYAQNSTTLIIYLDAKRTYFDALTDYYEALSKVAENRADLESAVGVPLELEP